MWVECVFERVRSKERDRLMIQPKKFKIGFGVEKSSIRTI